MTRAAFGVEIDQDQYAEAVALFEFVGGNSDDALRVGINKAGPIVRTDASKAIRAQVRLKASYLNKRDERGRRRLEFVRATRKNLSGKLTTPSRGVLLTRFSTDPNVNPDKVSYLKPPPVPTRGIRVKVKPRGAPKTVSGKPGEIVGQPFYLVLKGSRALAIAGRRATAGPGGGRIKVFYGPSLSQVFSSVRDDILPRAADTLEKQHLDAMRFLLNKQYPKE